MRRLGTAVATAALLLVVACSSDAGPEARPEASPGGSIGVYPEKGADDEGRGMVPDPIVADFGFSFGTLCTGPQGRPSPPTAAGTRDQVSDLSRVDGLTVTRELTLHRDVGAARDWVRGLRVEGPCVRVDGLRVTGSELTPLAGDPRAPRRLPQGVLLRSQVLRTSGSTDPVLLVDVVSRRGDAVLVTQVMRLSAPGWAYDVPLPAEGSERVVRRIDAEARAGVRLLERLGRLQRRGGRR